MGAARRHPSNRRLTWERLERGWSYDETAEQIKTSMRTCGEQDTGLTGATVRRWETGERWPESRFRKHLVQVFGKSASELGLLTSDELALRPADDQIHDLVGRLVSMMTAAPDGESFGRHVFLRGVLGAGLVPLLAPPAEAAEAIEHTVARDSAPDIPSIEAYRAITTHQRELYWTVPSRLMFESALSHAQLGVQMLRGVVRDEHRRQLADSVADSALLCGRLAFFDLRQAAVAQRCFGVALDAVREGNDHARAASVYAHMSFVPAFAGDGPNTNSLLDAAHAHARYDGGPLLRSWLHCVTAEVTARTGDPQRSLRHVRQAEDSLGTHGTDPEWLDFYDASRLAGFAGYSQLVAGNYGEATRNLRQSLDELDPKATKQRAVVLFDLAAAYAHDDAAHAAMLANTALDLLETAWYATAYERLPGIRAALASTPFAASLDERARILPPVGF